MCTCAVKDDKCDSSTIPKYVSWFKVSMVSPFILLFVRFFYVWERMAPFFLLVNVNVYVIIKSVWDELGCVLCSAYVISIGSFRHIVDFHLYYLGSVDVE